MIDRVRVRALRAALKAKLAELGKELELAVDVVGGASFTASNVVFKVEMAEIRADGEAMTREAEEFTRTCARWGMSPDDLGRTFRHNGEAFELIGASARARKFPLLAKRHDGQRFKFHPTTVKAGWE